MMSNLNSARALIQADLDHARPVVALWNNQIAEKALEQLDVEDNSLTVPRGAYLAVRISASGQNFMVQC